MSETHSKYIFQKQPNIGAVLEATVFGKAPFSYKLFYILLKHESLSFFFLDFISSPHSLSDIFPLPVLNSFLFSFLSKKKKKPLYCTILNYSAVTGHKPLGYGRNLSRSLVPGHTESGHRLKTYCIFR